MWRRCCITLVCALCLDVKHKIGRLQIGQVPCRECCGNTNCTGPLHAAGGMSGHMGLSTIFNHHFKKRASVFGRSKNTARSCAAAFITLSRLPVMLQLALWLNETNITGCWCGVFWRGNIQWTCGCEMGSCSGWKLFFPNETLALVRFEALSQWWRLLAFVFLMRAHKG